MRGLSKLLKAALEIQEEVSAHGFRGKVSMKVSWEEYSLICDETRQRYPDVRLWDLPIKVPRQAGLV